MVSVMRASSTPMVRPSSAGAARRVLVVTESDIGAPMVFTVPRT
jgi:hypothetical protein